MQKPRRQDVRPNKSVLKELKRVAKFSRGQKAFIDDIINKESVLLKSHKKNTKPIGRRLFGRTVKLSKEGQKSLAMPQNTWLVNPKPYYDRQYINWLTPHELVYITSILSTQLDCHVQPTHIDRNRIVEFDAVTMVFWKSMYIEKNTIRITIKKIKKAFANKDQYIDIKSIHTGRPVII